MAALAFIAFFFFSHLNLHCITLLFAAFVYTVFTAYPTDENNSFTAGQVR